jgi:hypothetical protein
MICLARAIRRTGAICNPRALVVAARDSKGTVATARMAPATAGAGCTDAARARACGPAGERTPTGSPPPPPAARLCSVSGRRRAPDAAVGGAGAVPRGASRRLWETSLGRQRQKRKGPCRQQSPGEWGLCRARPRSRQRPQPRCRAAERRRSLKLRRAPRSVVVGTVPTLPFLPTYAHPPPGAPRRVCGGGASRRQGGRPLPLA